MLASIAIYDLDGNICFFERVWTWGVDYNAEGVSSLVKAFNQISREIDAGDIVRVKFDPPAPTVRVRGRSAFQRQSEQVKAAAAAAEKQLEMCSQKFENIQVVIFYRNEKYDTVNSLAIRLGEAFRNQYSSEIVKHTQNKGRSGSSSSRRGSKQSNEPNSQDNSTLLHEGGHQVFSEFDAEVENLVAEYLSTRNNDDSTAIKPNGVSHSS